MFSEQDARLELGEALRNKEWILTGKNNNVLTEVSLKNSLPTSMSLISFF